MGTQLGLSWLGGGLEVSHTGSVLRATFQAHPAAAYKISVYQSDEGNLPFEGIAWIPATNLNESVVVGAAGGGTVRILLNVPADYWARGADAAVILSLESNGVFNKAPVPPLPRTLHILGDSITAATNIRGGFPKCADGGLYADYSSSWGGIICAFFNSNCHTVAVGGKGLVRNCCDAGTNVPQYYTQLKKNDPDGSYDFAADSSPPAAVIGHHATYLTCSL